MNYTCKSCQTIHSLDNRQGLVYSIAHEVYEFRHKNDIYGDAISDNNYAERIVKWFEAEPKRYDPLWHLDKEQFEQFNWLWELYQEVQSCRSMGIQLS